MSSRRALHFVFKVGDRSKTIKFFKDIMGMKILRHEEFDEGCKAACNGPYDGKWSKTMIGYGSEDDHFVIELTYNYGINKYQLGNDFRSISVLSRKIIETAKLSHWPIDELNQIQSPDGYTFLIVDKSQPENHDPVEKVSLSVSNLQRSIDYWHLLCGLKIFFQNDKSALLGFDENQCKLELVLIDGKVNHATAFGRIAFARPTAELADVEKKIKSAGEVVLTSLLTLQTPGKADVVVIILADPDGHEICFVGDEGFKQLSQFDPEGDKKLTEAMEADKSNEWFAQKGKQKSQA